MADITRQMPDVVYRSGQLEGCLKDFVRSAMPIIWSFFKPLMGWSLLTLISTSKWVGICSYSSTAEYNNASMILELPCPISITRSSPSRRRAKANSYGVWSTEYGFIYAFPPDNIIEYYQR